MEEITPLWYRDPAYCPWAGPYYEDEEFSEEDQEAPAEEWESDPYFTL